MLGEVDSRPLSTNFGYNLFGHTFSGGYQKVSGDNAYAYVGGTDTYLLDYCFEDSQQAQVEVADLTGKMHF